MSISIVKDEMYAAIYPVYPGGEKLDIKIVKVSPSPTARLTQNVMASGDIIYDSKVVMPVEVTCDVVLEKRRSTFENVRNTIYNMWYKRVYETGEMSAVRTKDGVLYKNLVLESCPHIEDADSYDAFVFTLKFREYAFVDGKDYSPQIETDG